MIAGRLQYCRSCHFVKSSVLSWQLKRIVSNLYPVTMAMSTSATSSSRQSSMLITPSHLASKLSSSNLRILDATWFMPGTPREPQKEFLDGPRIQGAAGFWSVDDIADKAHPLALKHMMPDPVTFAKACCKYRHLQTIKAQFLEVSKIGEIGLIKVSPFCVNGSSVGYCPRFRSYRLRYTFCLQFPKNCFYIQSMPKFSVIPNALKAKDLIIPSTGYLLQAFGHEKIYVLDGGLPRWISEGLPTANGEFAKPFPVSIAFSS